MHPDIGQWPDECDFINKLSSIEELLLGKYFLCTKNINLLPLIFKFIIYKNKVHTYEVFSDINNKKYIWKRHKITHLKYNGRNGWSKNMLTLINIQRQLDESMCPSWVIIFVFIYEGQSWTWGLLP